MDNQTKQPSRSKQHRPPVKRREILVLVGIWLAGCAFVGGLIGLFYLNSSPADSVPPPGPVESVEIPFSGGSAKTAYLSASKAAQDWQPDVKLVSLSTNWDNATPDTLGAVDSWNVNFYSEPHQRIFVAVVAANQEPFGRAHPFKLRRPPLLLNSEAWVVDSNEALSIWVSNGGNAFLQAFPKNQVEMLLRQSADPDRPVWNIIGASGDQSQIFFLTIDATNGQILNQNR